MTRERAVLLSVVTVTYADREGVARTLNSLEALVGSSGGAIEVLIQDGAPGGEEFYAAWPWAKAVCASDQGLYDAMNRALLRASGQHVWFLNGGDECSVGDWQLIGPILSHHPDELVFASYSTFYAGREVVRLPRRPSYIRHALPSSHQAILYPRLSLPSRGYDLTYKMAADYALTASVLTAGAKSARTDLVLARFYPGGTSTLNAAEIARDARRVQREILGCSWMQVVLSQCRHLVSRSLHRLMHQVGAMRSAAENTVGPRAQNQSG